MADVDNDTGTQSEETYEVNEQGVAYSTESAPGADTPARPATIAPAAATGRRKEAVARVRLVPGTVGVTDVSLARPAGGATVGRAGRRRAQCRSAVTARNPVGTARKRRTVRSRCAGDRSVARFAGPAVRGASGRRAGAGATG